MADLTLGLRINVNSTNSATAIRGVTREINTLNSQTHAANQTIGDFKNLLIGAASAFTLSGLINQVDIWTNLEGRLKLVTAGTAELIDVQNQLFLNANNTRNSLETTIELYERLARNQKELNVTTQEMIDLTDTIGKTLVISGGSAVTASAAMIQLGQSFASGIINGDEFRAIAEQAPRLLRAIAEGWENADGTIGTSIGNIRKLALDQQLTVVDKVVPALQRAAKRVNYEFAQMPLTIGQALVTVQNHFQKFIGVTGQTSGIAAAVASSIVFLGENIDVLSTVLLGGAAAWVTYKAAVVGVSFVEFISRIVTAAQVTAAHTQALAMNEVMNARQIVAQHASNVALAETVVATETAAVATAQYNVTQAQLAVTTVNCARAEAIRTADLSTAIALTGFQQTATAQLTASQSFLASSEARLTSAQTARATATAGLTTATTALNRANAATAASTTLVARTTAFFTGLIPALRAELVALSAVNPVALAITGLAAASAALYLYRNEIVDFNGQQATIGEYARATWEAVKTVGSVAWRDLVSITNTSVAKIKNAFDFTEGWKKSLKDFVSDAWDILRVGINYFIGFEEAIGIILTNPFTKQYKTLDELKAKLKSTLTTDYLSDLNSGFLLLTNSVQQGVNSISDYAGALHTINVETEKFEKLKDLQVKLSVTPAQLNGVNLNAEQEKLAKEYTDNYKKATMSSYDLELDRIKSLTKEASKERAFLIDLLNRYHAVDKQGIKDTSELAKASTDARIKDIERLTNRTIKGIEEAKKANDFQYESNTISARQHYETEIDLIEQATKAKIAALEQQKNAQAEYSKTVVSSTNDIEKALIAIKQIESSGGKPGQVNISYKKDGTYNGTALGTGQAMISTLLKPGHGLSPFQPAVDDNIRAFKEDYNKLKQWVLKNDIGLTKFGEDYFKALVRDLGSVEKAVQAYGNHTAGYMAKFKKYYSDINSTTKETITVTADLKEIEDKIAQARQEGNIAKADAYRAYLKDSKDYQTTLAQEQLKLIELTGTVEDYIAAKSAYDLNNNPAYQQAKKTGKQADIQLFESVQKAEDLKALNDSAKSYQDTLDNIGKSTKELGLTSLEAFDIMNKGFGGLSNAFNSVIGSIDKFDEQLLENAKLAKAAAENHDFNETKKANLAKLYANESKKLEQEKTKASLQGTRQVVGAVGNMFGENTKARKAFHALEIGLTGIELATTLSASGAKIAANLKEIASNAVKATSGVIAGAAQMFADLGPFGFAAVGAMMAVMAGLGYAASSAGGSGSVPIESAQTGTVLGDNAAKSNSTQNIYELLKSIHADEYPELQAINAGVNNLHSAIERTVTSAYQVGMDKASVDVSTDLGDLLTHQFGTLDGLLATGLSTALSFGISTGVTALVSSVASSLVPLAMAGIGGFAGPIGFAVGGLFSLIDSLFTDVSSSIEKQFLTIKPQSLSSIQSTGIQAQQDTTIRTVYEHMFWDSVERQDVTQALNNDVTTALTDVFNSVGQTMYGLADQLDSGLKARIASYEIPEIKIDILNKTAEEASDALNAALSTTLDKMVNDTFGSIVGQYQKLGEGMLETAQRVAIDVAIVRNALGAASVGLNSNAVAISESLVSMAGGTAEFAQMVNNYRDAFYSDSEKTALLFGQLNAVLKQANVILPQTREQYKRLLDSYALNIEIHQKEYMALLKSASAADKYYQSLESGLDTFKSAVTETFDAVKTIFNNIKNEVKSAYDAYSNLANVQINKYQQLEDSLNAFSRNLSVNSLASNPTKDYYARLAEFNALKKDIQGTDKDKKDIALSKLPTIGQDFLTASKAVNKSGVGYLKDFAMVNALIPQGLNYAQSEKENLKSELEKITDSLTDKGILSENITDVTTAVNAVTAKIAELDKSQLLYDQALATAINTGAIATETNTLAGNIANLVTAIGKFDEAVQNYDTNKTNVSDSGLNYEAYYKSEINRKQQYEQNIAKSTASATSQGIAIENKINSGSGMFSNYAGSERLAQSSAIITPSTKSTNVSFGKVESGKPTEVKDRITERYGYLTDYISSIVSSLKNIGLTGSFPSVKVNSEGDNHKTTFLEYSFSGFKGRVNSGDIYSLMTQFTDSAVDYLAGQVTNKELSNTLISAPITSVQQGLRSVSDIVQRYNKPFEQSMYNPKTDYTKLIDGSHKDGLDFVPKDNYVANLHYGERVLTREENRLINSPIEIRTTVDNSEMTSELKKLLNELKELKKELKKSNEHGEANVKVDQTGLMRLIKLNEEQTNLQKQTMRRERIYS